MTDKKEYFKIIIVSHPKEISNRVIFINIRDFPIDTDIK